MEKRTEKGLFMTLELEKDPEAILGAPLSPFFFSSLTLFSAALQKTWRSAIYHFFTPNVTIGYEDKHLFYFFKCTARVCKSANGGVHRYQDSKDRNSTTNLKQHAIRCFGVEAVDLCLKPTAAEAANGSILSKLRNLSFAIINSTTKALPAWKRCCRKLKKKARLIPRDVTTHWNSTYDMMTFSLQYTESIDAITADKATKLRKYELDDGDWAIAQDLVAILKVSSYFFFCSCAH
jgi:hypothetical protein